MPAKYLNGEYSSLQAQKKAWFHKILLYIKLPALKRPPVWETGQRLADGPELLLPFLQLFAVFKVCGGWQGESIPDPNHKGEQDQRHDPLRPAEKEQTERSGLWGQEYLLNCNKHFL